MAKRKQVKYDYVTVQKIFKEYNCQLLSRAYKNVRSKLDFRCSCGKVAKITLRTFLYSHKCRECTKKDIGDKHRFSIEEAKNFFIKNECILLSGEYDTCHDKLTFLCSCGRIGKKSLALFQKSPRCQKCISKNKSDSQKFSYRYIKEYFEKYGCKLLSKTYKNSWSNIDYVCSCGRASSITFCEFIRGSRCRKCYIERNSGSAHRCWEPDREKLNENKKFRWKIRNVLRCCLRSLGVKKSDKTEKLLGYTVDDLKNHLKNHENWDSVKDKCWHIDHIFPIQAFLNHDIQDIKIINCLQNLRPLLGHDNFVKNMKYNEEDFIKWLFEKHNIVINPNKHF